MSKSRKLLTPSVLEELARLTELGVPVASAMRQLDLEDKITRPTIVMLLKSYVERYDTGSKNFKLTLNSLFPTWLSQSGEVVQEQPESWEYIGRFPQGHWECKV